MPRQPLHDHKTEQQHKKQGNMVKVMKEALAVCSDKSLSAGVTVWDIDSGDHLLHIPTCASPLHGLLCLANHSIVASQVQRLGSFAGGAIFIWPLNKGYGVGAPANSHGISETKPQSVLRNYCLEAIGPISSTRDGLYLAGGAPSGNAFIWEVSSGRMVKKWSAHQRSISCLAFSMDGSLLVSGSNEGEICVWDLISLLEVAADCGSVPSSFLSRLEHGSSITGLICTSGSSSSMLVSSSLDGTCKVWDLFSGELLSVRAFPQPVNAIIIDHKEQFLFSGCTDGRIFVSAVDSGVLDVNASVASEDQLMVLSKHKGSITALSFSLSGQFLISASEDCTACLWDVKTWSVTRRFNHKKGQITNIVTVPQSSLIAGGETSSRASHQPRVSLLDKYPQPVNNFKGTVAVLPSSLADNDIKTDFRSASMTSRQILDLETGKKKKQKVSSSSVPASPPPEK
ncbi:hypothetical protein Scep_016171 [Stephania cephalantha]|uniref:Uncharacterized protein n=1 Tax=Stephania cephalantha TaxID=152367 RepID=A0AAP0IM46_9MAGN